MKRLFLIVAIMLLAVPTFSQVADYHAQQITIDYHEDIDNCELTVIVDDIYYEVVSYELDGSKIHLYLAEDMDYHLIINGEYFGITLHSRDVIDEQDMSISSDVDYKFTKGMLVFDY